MADPTGAGVVARAFNSGNRDIFHDRNQVLMYGIAIGMTILSTELGVFQKILGLTSLAGNQWLIGIGFVVALLLVDEVIKVCLRQRRSQAKA